MGRYNYLIRGNPLTFNSELAESIGLYQAIILQKIAYLLDSTTSGRVLHHDGERWLFNTYEQWQSQFFPFMSVITVKRTINELEDKGLIVSCQPEGAVSRKKYYRIGNGAASHLDIDRVNEQINFHRRTDQIDPMDGSNCTVPLTEKTTEKTTYSLSLESDGEGEPTAKPSRKRDECLEELAKIDTPNVTEVTRWGKYAKFLSELRKATPDLTPEEIRRRAALYKSRNPTWPLTANALVNHWAALMLKPTDRARLGENLL